MTETRPLQARQTLRSQLARLGVVPGDLLMLHASLRAVGPVEGGAAGLIEALEETVGPAGTLLMVLGAEDPHAWVNKRPEEERVALLAEVEPFDPENTPALGEIGKLAEVFRRTPGTRVSDHPEGRFGARGARAADLVLDQPWDDYYGPGSPLEQLVNLGGKVLRLGADLNTVTLLHYAEYLVPLVRKRRARRYRRVTTPDGPQISIVDCLDDECGIVAWEREDYFALIMREYLETGRASRGTVGSARSELVDAADLVDFAVAWMTENFT